MLGHIASECLGKKQKGSTEGCSKFKSPETRQVQERLVSTLEHIQVPKVGQDQVSGGVSVPCRHATPVADVLLKPVFSNQVKVSKKSSQGKVSQTGVMYN